MQFVAKFVSLVWIQRRQHKFSYPCFFHFAIRFPSAIFSCKSIINLPPNGKQYFWFSRKVFSFWSENFKTHLDTKFVQLSWYGLPPVEQIIDISGLLMMDLENWPQSLCFPLALVTFSLGLPHLGFQFLGIEFFYETKLNWDQPSGYNLQCGLYQLPAFRWWLAGTSSDFRHLWGCNLTLDYLENNKYLSKNLLFNAFTAQQRLVL